MLRCGYGVTLWTYFFCFQRLKPTNLQRKKQCEHFAYVTPESEYIHPSPLLSEVNVINVAHFT